MPLKTTIIPLSKITKGMEKGYFLGLLDGAELMATNIGKETPVKTGRLRSSVAPIGKVEKTGKGFNTRVESKVEYAKFVEFGTVKMKARGMFRKGADKSQKGILNLIKARLPKDNGDL